MIRYRNAARSERGVALVISMVLLISMSLLAVSTLSGSRLNERAADNAQQKAIAFEVAESAIESGFVLDELVAALDEIPLDQFDTPDARPRPGLSAGLGVGFDQRRTTRGGTDALSVDIEADVSIQYCGETPLPDGSSLSADESDTQLVGLLFDVNGVATVANSATRADHVQRGSLVRPRSGRRGGCVTRGVDAP